MRLREPMSRTAYSPSERVLVGISAVIESLTPDTTAIPRDPAFVWDEERMLPIGIVASDQRKFMWSMEQTGEFDPPHDVQGCHPTSVTISRELYVLYYVGTVRERDIGGIHADARIIARGLSNAIGSANENIRSLSGVENVRSILVDQGRYSIDPDESSEDENGMVLTMPVTFMFQLPTS